jgi:hypothetical protein
MLWSGAPECPVCHRKVSGAPGPYRTKPATLGFQQAHSTIIHLTVRCASGATAKSRNGRLQKPLTQMNSEEQCAQSQSTESEAHRTMNRTCPVWHRTVRCHKKTTAPTVDCSQTLTVGWRGGAPDSEQDLSGGAPYCPVHPSPAAFSNDFLVVEGYKYPLTTTTPSIKVFWSSHSIQELVHLILDRIQKIKASPSPKFIPTT